MNRRALIPLVALVALVGGCAGGEKDAATPSPSASAAVTSATPKASPSAATGALALKKLASFDSPVWAGPVPGDPEHLYLVQKTGKVLRIDTAGRTLGTVLDLTGQVSRGNEQGLLSIAFDPAYRTNHTLYADYTNADGDTRVMSYTVTADRAGAGTQLLAVDQPYANHNGGLLLFDKTGKLLVGLGDGGSGGDPQNHAQDLSSDLGKILRLDPATGAGAADNPYPQNKKVWAYGLRNPWRFSFDSNGDLYVGDVGQDAIEELDVVPAADQRGANYGWPTYEGRDRYKGDRQLQGPGTVVTPALTYKHSDGGCSITGGETYRGKALPALRGRYVFGDYCAGALLSVVRTPTGVTRSTPLDGLKVDGLQAFGHDADGELLVLSADSLYRLVAA